MPIPANVDPNARTRCPECKALTLAADWRFHADWHDGMDERLAGIEDALKEPAPEPELVDWPAPPEPATDEPDRVDALGPEPASGPQL